MGDLADEENASKGLQRVANARKNTAHKEHGLVDGKCANESSSNLRNASVPCSWLQRQKTYDEEGAGHDANAAADPVGVHADEWSAGTVSYCIVAR